MRRVISALGAAVLAALALTASAQADNAVVPMLTGGEVHWTGNATRIYNVSATDPMGSGSQTQDSGRSKVTWDSRVLISAYYSDGPKLDRPEYGIVLPTDLTTHPLGPGSSHHWELDCDYSNGCSPAYTKDCTWTENGGAAGALALDSPADHDYAVFSFSPGWPDPYSCRKYSTDDPGLWEDCGSDRAPGYAASVCDTEFKFPAKPLEGDQTTVTRTFNHAAKNVSCSSPQDWPCTQTGHSTMTISCALCVTDIQFQQPDLPSRSLIDVAPDGTFDGNRVRVTATIHNATKQAIKAPVRFRDLTVERDLTPAPGGEKPAAEITVAAGQSIKVVLDWNTDGFAWYPPHKPDPHKIAVLTPYGGARRDLAVRPKPVLLVHGFNAKPSTWDGYPDLFTGVRKDWLVRAATGMDTDPWSGNTLAQNARILGDDIQRLRNEYDAEHIDLVGHSMGGLISRQYLQADAPDDPDHRPVVAHLVMLGTPNEGSNCAYVAAITAAKGAPTLQLTPAYLWWFNKHVTNTRGTKLSVLAGIAPTWEENASRVLCSLPKPNDLVVWQKSAFWTLTDTATQMGLVHTQMTHDELAFHSFVEPHLEVAPEGAAARDSNARTAAPPSQAATPSDISGLALARTIHVRSGHSTRTRLRLTGGSALDVMTLAPAGVRLQLVSPAGKVVQAATSAGEMSALSAGGRLHGTWTIVAANPTHSSAPVSMGARIAGDPFQVTPQLKVDGGKLMLTVAVSGGGRHPQATAIESSPASKASGRRVRLHAAHGRFTATLEPMAGGTIVTVTVRGAQGTRTAVAAN